MLSIVARGAHLRSGPTLLSAAAAVTPCTRSIYTMRRAPLRPQLHLASSTGSVGLGLATRQLSLWPFGKSSNSSQAEAKVDEVLQAGKEKAHEAADQVKETANEAAASASSSLDAAAQKGSDVVQSVSSSVQDGAASVSSSVQEGAAAVSQGETHSRIIDAVASVSPDVADTLAHAAEATHIDMATLQQNHGTIISSMQTLLDYAHNATGLPWWATVAAVTVSIRLLLLPVVLYGQTNAIRLANIQPQLAESMETIKIGKEQGDQVAMAAAVKRTQELMRDNNCHPLRSLVTPLVQGPLFITFFIALRGLGQGGLTELKTQGLAWVPDLTMADPYYALPVIGSLLTLVTLETGAEMGASPATQTQQQIVMRNVLRVVCVAAIPFVAGFPSIVFFYMVTNSLFSLCQLLILKTAFARRLLNIPERKVHDPSDRLVGRRAPLPKQTIVQRLSGQAPSQTPTVLRSRSPVANREAAMRELTEEPDSVVDDTPTVAPSAAVDADADRKRQVEEARRQRVAEANAKRKRRSRV